MACKGHRQALVMQGMENHPKWCLWVSPSQTPKCVPLASDLDDGSWLTSRHCTFHLSWIPQAIKEVSQWLSRYWHAAEVRSGKELNSEADTCQERPQPFHLSLAAGNLWLLQWCPKFRRGQAGNGEPEMKSSPCLNES